MAIQRINNCEAHGLSSIIIEMLRASLDRSSARLMKPFFKEIQILSDWNDSYQIRFFKIKGTAN